jgi:hypothetical protein
MKNTFLKTIGETVFIFAVIAILTSGSAFAQNNDQSQKRDKGLEGTWDAQVTIRNCQTGAAIRTFASIGTFMSGGTMLDSTSGVPQSLKTPGHGIWKDFGGNLYQFKFKSFSFDASGNSTGWTIIKHDAYMVNPRGDQYESAGTSEVYAPNGNLLFTGCSSTTAKRFE